MEQIYSSCSQICLVHWMRLILVNAEYRYFCWMLHYLSSNTLTQRQL